MRVFRLNLLSAAALFLSIPAGLSGDIPLNEAGDWNLYGRFRLRIEQDNDKNPLVSSRSRMRIGNYAGVKFTPDDQWEFHVRGRLGDKRDSRIVDMTVVTFDNYSHGQRGAFADQYFARYKFDRHSAVTLGRATMPFWANTEKLWDEDLTPLGGSFSGRFTSGDNPLSFAAGAFHMPDGMQHFHAWMYAAQLRWAQTGQEWNWQWALSLFDRQGEPGARYLPLGQDDRDYLIAQLSARLSGHLLERPAYVGIDIFENLESYAENDPDFWTSTYRDETTGFAVALNWGENKKKGDWRLRYVYARVEWLAALSSYATTSFGWLLKSNVEVNDFRADYSLSDRWKVTGRISPARNIIGSRKSTRYRVDFSRSF